jgi:hypothetical protein
MDNIFKYATSELSNDAFLCWLFSISKNEDPNINSIEYRVSQGYLNNFCNYKGKIIIYEDGIVRQEEKIDVLIKGKYNSGEEFILSIENKTLSKEHDKQLERYRDYINEKYKHIKNRHFIYYKTAIQSNEEEIKEIGYSVFQIKKIFDLLDTYEAGKSENLILKNYFDFIKEEVELYFNFMKIDIKEWDEKAFQGFFYYLLPKIKENKNIKKHEFGYNDNRNGGRWSLWFGSNKRNKNKNDEEIGFHLNLEMATKNGNENWACRLIIRADERKDKSQWKESDIEQYIGRIGEDIRHQPGKNIILAKLFQVDNESSIYTYKELEKNIMLELDKYIEWQDNEGFK